MKTYEWLTQFQKPLFPLFYSILLELLLMSFENKFTSLLLHVSVFLKILIYDMILLI